MFDVITIGSAVRDVFVQSRDFKVLKTKVFKTGEALAMSLGSKLYIEDLKSFTGGGAVNTAITFANQGLKVGALTVVGDDSAGHSLRDYFQEKGIARDFLIVDKKGNTACSIILTTGKRGRTILSYGGAEWHLRKSDIPWKKLAETKWIYLNHLGGESADLVPEIIGYADRNNIKVAWNPGKTQLEDKKRILPYLYDIDVFIVNQEEASYVTGELYEEREKIFSKLDKWVRGLVIMTRGAKGVEVSDGKTRWSSGVLPLKRVVDRTGAGDAFGSGLVAALIKKPGDIEYAIQFASANATGVLTQWGASKGLLKKSDSPTKYGTLQIKKTML
ncbi:MAG: hypothetical protein A3J30_03185 [Candidatus Wildermuthbacteria bacterium RIFCSPLOWO2_02_FULL_47_9c]|uniref:PfkB family kinase, nonfunctional n=2 Tax=Parcubacteria group TaxID=1794811 RepID=A0A837IQP5_9BACT|nr:MAG: PfkB family kinase, nonfunctional [Candidatus Yanofskybacteria bacterium GW2011_GWC1_48_11]KKW04481.1 MAG: PfkB family kinase, nonfunctional [Parcubacteria group bacterium GW2011_GWB1_49_12]KKW09263.1 MAG: PfkB family kinase, nonfunctional [Parcubacteria group bacterium GW2011_GWA1_49_26]KKW14099.1 MAG: PfkB family kinase, nonfunctional [Parcubacteria group bacterium GW2011_GWA2_50_10]OHA61511.1 MAG: hypothetical protein A2109_01370 [Candidatus Wildermuthbacteria bacterium GWA1_49_26]O